MASTAPPLKRTNSLQKARAKLGRLLTRKPKDPVPVVEVSPPPPEDSPPAPAGPSPTSPDALQLPKIESQELLENVDSSKVSEIALAPLFATRLVATDPSRPAYLAG